MRDLTRKLDRQIKLGQLIDQKLAGQAGRRDSPPATSGINSCRKNCCSRSDSASWICSSNLAVNQQGVLSLGLIMRNNEELMRGVNRARRCHC
jgi:uncharacterized protein YaaN involved in tellurite resistance